MDAIELLKKDHQEVTKLFQRYRDGGSGREAVVDKICTELEVHSQVEEELFYPAVRATGDEDLDRQVDESLWEHQRVKQQVSALRAGPEQTEMEGMVANLERDVEHHVTEEEGEMFPRVRELMDGRKRSDLGRRMQERKQALLGGRPARARPSAAARKVPTRRTRARTTRRQGKAKGTASRSTGAKSRGRKRARGR